MIPKKTTLLAWILMLISAGMMFFVSFVDGFQRNPGLYLPIVLVYIALGGLLAIRNPRNAIGWVFLAGISLLSINAIMVWYATSGLVVNPGSLPRADVVAAVMGVVENLGYGTVLIIPFLLFPNGHLISRRWIPVLWLVGIAMVLQCIEIFQPGPLPNFPDWINPLGIAQLSGYFEISGYINGILAVLLFAVGPLSIFLRYQWASMVERQQIKWFAFAGILVSIWILFLVFFSEALPEIVGILLESLMLASVPLAIAIAILRYRLWDIDIIIRRTLQYTLLTGLLAVLYFGSVLLLQNLVETLTGEQSPVVIVISTLGIAALFNPLRIRIQGFIDQRFYRRKYDAERALAQFAETARDEVDMHNLVSALLQVVEETMEPKKAILWLKTGRDGYAS